MKKSLPALAVFLTFALVCSYIESLIPIPFGVPGMKLGLTNVVIILLLYLFGPFDAIVVSILRVLLIGFMFGNLYSLCYSLAGGLLSFICMYLLYRFSKFKMITVSVVGGFMHNVGQLIVAIFFFDTGYLIYYLPVLLITGVVTGAVIGVIAQAVYIRIDKFLHKEENVDVFIPGRFCIMGEHSDWASSYRAQNADIEKGYAIVVGLKEGIYLNAKKADTFTYEFKDKRICLTKEQLLEDNEDEFFGYVISSAKVMLDKYNVYGIIVNCSKATIPMKKGLSSSAAICVGIIRAFNLVYGLNISVDEEMNLAFIAENNAGSMCGRLDQICAYGSGLRLVEFDGEETKISEIKYSGKWAFLAIDLEKGKNTKKILSDLNSHYPVINDDNDRNLHDFLGPYNKDIVNRAKNYLENEQYKELGEIMCEYQEGFDTNVAICSKELKAPYLHEFFHNIKELDGVLGYKGVGSGGDGMAQILVEYDKKDSVKQYIEEKLELECILIDL